MITHKQFIDKWLGKRYRETVELGYQCAALVKLYCNVVYGIKGLSFGGSAINAWNGKGNLDQHFDKVEVGQQGDIFFCGTTPTNPYGHTGIVNNHQDVIEQNAGNGNGDGLGNNAIRIAKAPKNIVGYMRLKSLNTTPIKHLLQGSNPDCSLAATVNCYILNNGQDASRLTQDTLDEYMESYLNKNPRDAFNYLKGKGYNIKLLPLTFEKAKIRLNKGSAVVLFIKGDGPRNSHWTCCKQIDGKYWIYDSTRTDRYELTDIDTPYKNGIFTDSAFQIK